MVRSDSLRHTNGLRIIFFNKCVNNACDSYTLCEIIHWVYCILFIGGYYNYRDINDIHDSELGLYYEIYFLSGKQDFKNRNALFDEFYGGLTSLN